MVDPRAKAKEARARLEAAMRRLAAGEQAALGDIYRSTHAKLFGIALRILGNRRDAEDTIQDVYVALWQKAKRYDPARASPISWLAVVARNNAIDRLRRRAGRGVSAPVEAAEMLADPVPLAEDQMVDAEHSARIHTCLAELEAQQGEAIRGAYLEGQTYATLAELQGVPLSTMKSRIRRGLARLKVCLEREP